MVLDQQLLEWVNGKLANPFFDAVFVFVSLLGLFVPYALAALVPWRLGRRREAAARWSP